MAWHAMLLLNYNGDATEIHTIECDILKPTINSEII